MQKLIALALAAAATSVAHAEPKPLEVTVFTASPGGFLVNSTLISGEKDAVLIDAQFDLADAHRLAAQILESKKNLTTIYITHEHPDHYFGAVVLHQAFPKAKIVALPATVKEIEKSWQPKVKQWGPMYGDNLTTQPVLPTALAGKTLTLEGQTLEIHASQGDSAGNTYVWIPSIKTAIVGDIGYRGVFPWTAETNAASRKAWAKTLDEVAALHPTTVISGHKDPKAANDVATLAFVKTYLTDFDAAVASSKTPEELQKKVTAKYPELQLPIILQIGAGAAFAH